MDVVVHVAVDEQEPAFQIARQLGVGRHLDVETHRRFIFLLVLLGDAVILLVLLRVILVHVVLLDVVFLRVVFLDVIFFRVLFPLLHVLDGVVFLDVLPVLVDNVFVFLAATGLGAGLLVVAGLLFDLLVVDLLVVDLLVVDFLAVDLLLIDLLAFVAARDGVVRAVVIFQVGPLARALLRRRGRRGFLPVVLGDGHELHAVVALRPRIVVNVVVVVARAGDGDLEKVVVRLDQHGRG